MYQLESKHTKYDSAEDIIRTYYEEIWNKINK